MGEDAFASAEDLGLMQGFPPPPTRRVNRSNALMTPPFNRWSYLHMRTLYPSAGIPTPARPSRLDIERDERIDGLRVRRESGEEVGFETFVRETYTDALVVLTRDRIVHEHYSNGMRPDQPHQMMSVTKSFAGLLGLLAVHDGHIDESDAVSAPVPELAASSAFRDATFGQVLDMVNSMEFSEDYADPGSSIVRYGKVLGWIEVPGTEAPAEDLYEFLVSLTSDPALSHGDVFRYQTPKTDVVNWVTNRVTGRSFQEALHERLWSPIGTEGETYVLLDRGGTLVAGGGLNACPHDLARFAMMLLRDGSFEGRQVVPRAVVDEIFDGGDLAAFAAGPESKGVFGGGDWSYRAQWWVRHTPGREAITAIGIHGQWVYIDRRRGVAIVKQSSQPVSAENAYDEFTINAFDAIIDHLA